MNKAVCAIKKTQFLDAFSKCGTILAASKHIGVDRSTITDWLNKDKEFVKKFASADLHVTQQLEDKAFAKAMDGDNTMIIFLLKCRSPKKYMEKYIHEVKSDQLSELTGMVVALLKQNIPEFCPGCKTHLNFKPELAKKLMDLSAHFSLGKASA